MDIFKQIKPLHEEGFALLWLYANSKRPIGDSWQKGDRLSWEKLTKQYRKPMNVGVRLGTPSKLKDGSYLCVLDCDVKSSDPIHLKEMEMALMNFCPSHEFAPRVLSGRGGGSCHFYFRTKYPQQSFKAIRSGHKIKAFMPSAPASQADKEVLTSDEIDKGFRMRLAWEIDVFGEGKQVVLPPSIHPDSLREYEWEVLLRDYEAIPLHKNFTPSRVRLTKAVIKEVSFEHVDLFSAPISEKYFGLITSGSGFENYPSRSEALFASLNALIYAGLTDGQILSVLTDRDNFISEKPLEAGKGDVESAGRWLQTQIDKIRQENSFEELFKDHVVIDDLDEILALTDAEAAEQEDELVSWVTRLERTKIGHYKPTAYNIYLILKNLSKETPTERCVFSYDEFNQSNLYTFMPPWGETLDVGRELADLDDIRIQTWLSQNWGIEASGQRVADITLQLGKENAFHPVQRYLKGLKWDGKERLNTMLSRYCGAEGDSRYLADVGRKFLCAAVARVMHPGCKFDHMLILEGAQGVGKSTFARMLADPWSCDSLGDITNKDVVDNMRGAWIIEIGELASMNRSEVNEMKAFITRQSDKVRKAYGRRSQTYPRQCIFIGTTNNDEYLKDETGGRRFWCVPTTNYDLAALLKDRDQLWAEAYYRWTLAEALYLDDPEVREIAEDVQSTRYIVDEIQGTIRRAIEDEEFPDEFTYEDLNARLSVFNGGKGLSNYHDQIRVKKALRVMGYPKIRKRVDGDMRFVWAKKKDGVLDRVRSYKKF